MGSLNQFWADFTSKCWLVIAIIKTDGTKTVNRNPPGHFYSYLCPRELGIILFDIKFPGIQGSGAVISLNGSK